MLELKYELYDDVAVGKIHVQSFSCVLQFNDQKKSVCVRTERETQKLKIIVSDVAVLNICTIQGQFWQKSNVVVALESSLK